MSANVIMLTQLKKMQHVNNCKKVSILPNLFSNLLKQYKEKQDEIKKKKINFLMQEAYRYFYDLLEFPKLSDVDLPEFIYEEQRKRIAYQKASKALIDVIAEGRLEKCYSARVKQLNTRSKRG